MSTELQEHQGTGASIRPFRLDVQLHDLGKNSRTSRPLGPRPPSPQPQTLPPPVFPQHPELLTDEELELDKHASPTSPIGGAGLRL